MLSRRSAVALFASALAIPFAAEALAAAPPVETFSPEAFKAAQSANKPILIAIHAAWCPTCKIQKVILNDLLQKPAFKDLAVFRVDFDDQKEAVAGFGVDTQSTLIVFKGKQEAGRSTGDTNAGSITALLGKAI